VETYSQKVLGVVRVNTSDDTKNAKVDGPIGSITGGTVSLITSYIIVLMYNVPSRPLKVLMS
jgi:hypothetical protein